MNASQCLSIARRLKDREKRQFFQKKNHFLPSLHPGPDRPVIEPTELILEWHERRQWWRELTVDLSFSPWPIDHLTFQPDSYWPTLYSLCSFLCLYIAWILCQLFKAWWCIFAETRRVAYQSRLFIFSLNEWITEWMNKYLKGGKIECSIGESDW